MPTDDSNYEGSGYDSDAIQNDPDYDADAVAIALGHASIVGPKAYDIDGINRARNHWKKFSRFIPALRNKEPFESPPEVRYIQAYLKWRASKGKARLDKTLTVATLQKEFQQIRRAVRFSTSYRYTDHQVHDVFSFIDTLGKEKKASTRKRSKPVALYSDVADILYFLWCCDELTWTHPRQMLQITFYLILVGNFGLRPGEIVESSCHRNTNEGLKYKDFSLGLARDEEEGLLYQVKVKLRNRKFKRGDEGLAQEITLHEQTDPENIFACPVRFFMALALADEAFVGSKSADDFADRFLPSTTSSRHWAIRKDKEDLPIIRMLKGTAIHPSRILSASALHQVIQALGQRCGYKENITCYAFRRGFANGIEGKVSAPRLRELMSHQNDRTLGSYMSTDVGVDTQNAVRGLPQNSERVAFSSSVAFTRDLLAPKMPNAMLGKRWQHTALIEDRIQSMSKALPHLARRDIIFRIRKADFLKERETYFSASSEGVNHEIRQDQLQSPRLVPQPSELFKLVLRFDGSRRRAIDALWSTSAGQDSLSNDIQPLTDMARPSTFDPAYPRVKRPKGSTCPSCIKPLPLPKNGKPKINLHLLQCHLRRRRKPRTAFCFDCFIYIPEAKLPEHDAEKHLEDPEVYCGVLTWRTLIVRPGRCPFCLVETPPSRGLKRWFDASLLSLHVLNHLGGPSGERKSCPHPYCGDSFMDVRTLSSHFEDVHGIQMSFGRNKCGSMKEKAHDGMNGDGIGDDDMIHIST